MTKTIVWITGGSSGIGAALIDTVPFPEARIVEISRTGRQAEVEHWPFDLGDPNAWIDVESKLMAQMATFTGRQAIFIHAAATVEPIGFAGQVDSSAYQKSLLLNSVAPQMLGHAFLRATAQFKGDRYLLLISSGVAKTPYEGWSSYCAGKAALDQWVSVAGAEQRRSSTGCRIFSVNPGAVATPIYEQLRQANEQSFPAIAKFRDLMASGRLKDPRAIAPTIWGLINDPTLESGTHIDIRQRS